MSSGYTNTHSNDLCRKISRLHHPFITYLSSQSILNIKLNFQHQSQPKHRAPHNLPKPRRDNILPEGEPREVHDLRGVEDVGGSAWNEKL